MRQQVSSTTSLEGKNELRTALLYTSTDAMVARKVPLLCSHYCQGVEPKVSHSPHSVKFITNLFQNIY